MEAQKTKLHPLVAGAAAAVIVAAGVAVAAITGVLPGSKAEIAPTPEAKSAQPAKHVAAAQPAQHKPVCHDCGVIVEVKEVDVLGKGTGISESGTLHRVEEALVRREVEAAGFQLVGEGGFLRNPNDLRDRETPEAGQPKDEFVLKFRKP